LAHPKKILKLWRLPNLKVLAPNIETYVSILAHLYKFQENKMGQSIWEKVKCNWEHGKEHVKEHIVNLRNMLGTHWELDENIVRT
jgi:Zn-finger protein